MVLGVLHRSVVGIPVDVYVQGGHEDGNLNAFFLKIFVFDRFLDHHNLTVARGNDFVRLGHGGAHGVAEELNHRQVQAQKSQLQAHTDRTGPFQIIQSK